MLVDTHAHLYSGDFSNDRDKMIRDAMDAGVGKIILPNIDSSSIEGMMALTDKYPGICFPLMGLHPTSVDNTYPEHLKIVDQWLEKGIFFGIGETGIDLYWDKTWQKEQEKAFRYQLQIARSMNLPVVIHVRNSFHEVFSILGEEQDGNLRGVFHCFSGSAEEADKISDLGFYMGIGGVVTYKNSTLPETLSNVPLSNLVLETDAPYLAPVPYRGRRNESAYLVKTAEKIGEIYDLSASEVANITTRNAETLFNI